MTRYALVVYVTQCRRNCSTQVVGVASKLSLSAATFLLDIITFPVVESRSYALTSVAIGLFYLLSWSTKQLQRFVDNATNARDLQITYLSVGEAESEQCEIAQLVEVSLIEATPRFTIPSLMMNLGGAFSVKLTHVT